MDKRSLLIKKWQDFLVSLTPENQEKAISAKDVGEITQIGNISPEGAAELFDAREVYFSNPSGSSEKNNPDKEEHRHKEEKGHKDEGDHSHGPTETAQEENIESQQKITPEEADRRLNEAAEIGKSQQNLTPEAVEQRLRSLKEETELARSQAGSPLIIPHSLRATGQSAPNQLSQPSAHPASPRTASSPRSSRPSRKIGFGIPGGGIKKSIGKKILLNPWVLGIIIGLIAFFGLMLFIAANVCELTNGWPFREVYAPDIHDYCSIDQDSIPPPPPGFTINKRGPSQIENNEPIPYSIEITYDPSKSTYQLSELTLWDTPDFPHQEPTGITQPGAYDGQSVTWKLADFFDQNKPGIQQATFNLSVKPTLTDDFVVNFTYIDVSGASGGITTGIDSPPTNDACRGQYNGIRNAIRNDFNVENWNYGDPVCSYSPSRLRELISKTETQQHVNQGYVDFWMEITRCESPTYGPNGYARSENPGTVQGTWGLFQMGSSSTDGRPDPFKQNNLDNNNKRGDVTWQRQTLNAIEYNREEIGGSFGYWGSAMCLCWWPEHRNKPYCDDIRAKGTNNIYGPRAPANDCPPGTGLTCQTASRCRNDSCRP